MTRSLTTILVIATALNPSPAAIGLASKSPDLGKAIAKFAHANVRAFDSSLYLGAPERFDNGPTTQLSSLLSDARYASATAKIVANNSDAISMLEPFVTENLRLLGLPADWQPTTT